MALNAFNKLEISLTSQPRHVVFILATLALGSYAKYVIPFRESFFGLDYVALAALRMISADVPIANLMLTFMLSIGHNLQIVWTVVQFIFVNMMHDLFWEWQQRPAKNLLHYIPMLEYTSPADRNNPVSTLMD